MIILFAGIYIIREMCVSQMHLINCTRHCELYSYVIDMSVGLSLLVNGHLHNTRTQSIIKMLVVRSDGEEQQIGDSLEMNREYRDSQEGGFNLGLTLNWGRGD